MTTGGARGRARLAFRSAGLAGFTGTMLAGWLGRSRLGPRGDDPDVRDRWVRTWTKGLLRLYAIRLKVDGTIPPRGSGGRLIVSNHRSAIDIGILLSVFGGRMVSRHDLAGWPDRKSVV